MKLPESFPKIESPYYILAVPAWIQRLVIAFIILFQIFCIFLLYYSIVVKPAPKWVLVILIVLIIAFIFLIIQKQTWRRWVTFVANHNGCYFRKHHLRFEKFKYINSDTFIFVPWDNVGEISVGKISDIDGAFMAVIMKIKIPHDVFEDHFTQEKGLPRWAEGLKSKVDEKGYYEYQLANQFQDVEKIRLEILKFKR